MEAFTDIFGFMAGVPAMVGLILASITIFLASDWRLSLTGLLVQYVLVGIALTRVVQAELAVVRILVGVLAVSILYLSARHAQELKGAETVEQAGSRFFGLRVGWGAGPLGLPLRLLTVVLVALAVLRFFDDYRLLLPVLEGGEPAVPLDIAFVAFWLGGMGLVGLVLSGDTLRVAPALLTILVGFDLVYASLESSPAVIGFWGALILLAVLAFAYLATVQALGTAQALATAQSLSEKQESQGVGTGALTVNQVGASGLDEEGIDL
jgi:hypothetical protein